MLKVGITGGIGSGKTTICRIFNALGIPVFNADEAAKYLMENDSGLIKSITDYFGQEVFKNGKLDTSKLAALVFNNEANLLKLNSIVHPRTIQYYYEWQTHQTTPYTIKEAALLFETSLNSELDKIIGVSAPLELRIARAMKRSNLTREEVESRINKQMDEETKMNKCNFVIINDDTEPVLPQVLKLHHILINLSLQV